VLLPARFSSDGNAEDSSDTPSLEVAAADPSDSADSPPAGSLAFGSAGGGSNFGAVAVSA
jgi:hypothetical protein